MTLENKRYLLPAFTIIRHQRTEKVCHYLGQTYKNVIKTRITVPLKLKVSSEKNACPLAKIKILLVFLVPSDPPNIVSHSPYRGKEGG